MLAADAAAAGERACQAGPIYRLNRQDDAGLATPKRWVFCKKGRRSVWRTVMLAATEQQKMGAGAIAGQPRLYLLNPDGSLTDENGRILIQETVSDHLIRVPHLNPHVIAFSMPRGDIIGIKVIYQSHCWNVNFKEEMIGPRTIIMDGNRRRVFRSDRYEESRSLPAFLMDLGRQQVYWTPTDRNFGIYSATSISNGIAYTAFFTLAKERGRLLGSRHSLVMRVESAYPARQPARGMKVSAAAAIHACLKDKKLRYRP